MRETPEVNGSISEKLHGYIEAHPRFTHNEPSYSVGQRDLRNSEPIFGASNNESEIK